MPPVLGPVSPSPTRLWSRAGARGSTVRPSVTANTLASGPSRNSSSRMVWPASPWTLPTRAASTAARAAAWSPVTVTPLPAASPSALTTQGGPKSSRAAIAAAGSVKLSERAVGTPAAAMTSLANVLEPSMRAAAAVGPKTGRPRSRNSSATPATSGCSGPMMVRSTRLASAKLASPAASVAPTPGTFSATSAVPALPGTANSLSTSGLWASVASRACSRPPLPTTAIRILIPFRSWS
jgi:hypothetical protein